MVDEEIYEGFKKLHLSYGLLDINRPYHFDGAAGLPKPVTQMWCSAVMIETTKDGNGAL